MSDNHIATTNNIVNVLEQIKKTVKGLKWTISKDLTTVTFTVNGKKQNADDKITSFLVDHDVRDVDGKPLKAERLRTLILEDAEAKSQSLTKDYRSRLQQYKLDFAGRRAYKPLQRLDIKILKDIRITSGHSYGLILLVRTGVDGVEQYFPIAMAEREDGGVKRTMDRILSQAPCDTRFIEVAARATAEELRQNSETLRNLNPVLDEEGIRIDEDTTDIEDEVQRVYEAELERLTQFRPSRGDQLTSCLQNFLNDLSIKFLRGCEYPTEAAESVLKQCGSTLVMQSEDLILWGYPVSSYDSASKQTFTHHYADSFELAGNFTDFVVSHLDTINRCSALGVKMPKIISNRHDEACFHYFDLEALKIHEGTSTPAWDSALRKMDPDDAEVFRAFIYSIFDAENNGRQMLYLYDDGYSGKSCIIKALTRELGSLAGALSQDALKTQFAFSNIWDKRLVVYSDNKDRNLARYGKIHQALGGDPVSVEYKQKGAFNAEMNAKFLCAGNEMLSINTRNKSELTRVLPIKLTFTLEQMIAEGIVEVDEEGKAVMDEDGEPVQIGDRTYAQRLQDELWAFVANSRHAYDRLCPNRADIKRTKAMRKLLGEFEDECLKDYEMVFDELCVIQDGAFVSTKDLKTAFRQALEEYGVKVGENWWRDVKKWLDTHYHIKETVSKPDGRDGKSVRAFKGIRKIEVTDGLL